MRRSRLVLGSVLFGLSVIPWAVAPVVPFLGFEPGHAAALVGILVVGAEAIGVLAVTVVGREVSDALLARWRRRRLAKGRCPR